MAHLHAMEARLRMISEAFANLENGTLSREGLEELVQNTREVYERAVVIRHRAYEEQIFGAREVTPVQEMEISTLQETMEVEDNESEEEQFIEVEETIFLTNEEAEESLEPHQEAEQPAFDFSLFDDSAEVAKEEILEENTFEHISVSSVVTEDHGVQEEKVIMEQVSMHPTGESNAHFIQKFSKTDSDTALQISMSRLESLIGSFGLNERLQFINELFDGSSEAFADAIKSLDTLSSTEEALIKASGYAAQYNWDLHSETVEEFILKLKRRYA